MPFKKYLDRRYGACLLLILTSIIVQIAAPDSEAGHVLVVLLYGLTLLTAMTAAESAVNLIRLARVAVILLVLASEIGRAHV